MAEIKLDVEKLVNDTFGKHFGVTIDRLRELAEADKDGRCVVLPCKVGDKCYVLEAIDCSICPKGGGRGDGYLRCKENACPKQVTEKTVEGYQISSKGLSNPGEWGWEGLDTYGIKEEDVHYTRPEAEAALAKEDANAD